MERYVKIASVYSRFTLILISIIPLVHDLQNLLWTSEIIALGRKHLSLSSAFYDVKINDKLWNQNWYCGTWWSAWATKPCMACIFSGLGESVQWKPSFFVKNGRCIAQICAFFVFVLEIVPSFHFLICSHFSMLELCIAEDFWFLKVLWKYCNWVCLWNIFSIRLS